MPSEAVPLPGSAVWLSLPLAQHKTKLNTKRDTRGKVTAPFMTRMLPGWLSAWEGQRGCVSHVCLRHVLSKSGRLLSQSWKQAGYTNDCSHISI